MEKKIWHDKFRVRQLGHQLIFYLWLKCWWYWRLWWRRWGWWLTAHTDPSHFLLLLANRANRWNTVHYADYWHLFQGVFENGVPRFVIPNSSSHWVFRRLYLHAEQTSTHPWFKVTKGNCGETTDVVTEGKTGGPLKIIMPYYARIQLTREGKICLQEYIWYSYATNEGHKYLICIR